LHRLREARIGPIETYTPAPLEDASEQSSIPAIVLLAGLLGAAASFGLQAWSSMVAYPFHIGGRPQFAWPSFVVTAFENAVLVAVVGGFLSFLIASRMPRLYDLVDEADAMRPASSDGWVLAILTDETAPLARARTLLRTLNAARIEDIGG